ncbi:3-oxo-5-alpha-steroid 4-dehydrogenase [Neofusicoccum parvum]|uniref:3-oxo-5-alpha-steroid 4-dehydrogenase n=1 Tax=Neofusicoccum parvum TaxID=310453 RepID=A0ACB5RYQ3_9PEZI|nr:3-oxo-5-alpha-steroid 4-dehydrogenase [Neofusicoccum parvum]GME53787.1 3-oxo-5-alpha-steroid 4-dehydrogenase [Neofusicoccum parvum]
MATTHLGPLLARLEPAVLLRSLFLTAASIVLAVDAVPAFRSRFLAYGSRAPSGPGNPASPTRTASARLLDHLATYRVPHSWFAHFYVLSVLGSIFWAEQYATDGALLKLIASRAAAHRTATMSVGQVQAAWLLMLAQGARRLYESVVLSRPSSSKMWITHWLLGLLFYGAMSIAVWVEGTPALQASADNRGSTLPPLDLKLVAGASLFLWASKQQHDAHAYLFGLRKYTLPTQGYFQTLVCPHYTFECLVYLALSIVAAPEGAWLNKTVLCALGFVGVNLGVTAAGTKEWYATKFGRETVEHRARMVPFIW